MIGRLEPGLWINNRSCGQFGISHGQLRKYPLLRFCGWYNIDGRLLGAGDFCTEDVVKVSKMLMGNEVFLVLPHPNDGRVWTSQDSLGVAETANRCSLVITRKRVSAAYDFDELGPADLYQNLPGDIRFERLLRGRIARVVQNLNKKLGNR